MKRRATSTFNVRFEYPGAARRAPVPNQVCTAVPQVEAPAVCRIVFPIGVQLVLYHTQDVISRTGRIELSAAHNTAATPTEVPSCEHIVSRRCQTTGERNGHSKKTRREMGTGKQKSSTGASIVQRERHTPGHQVPHPIGVLALLVRQRPHLRHLPRHTDATQLTQAHSSKAHRAMHRKCSAPRTWSRQCSAPRTWSVVTCSAPADGTLVDPWSVVTCSAPVDGTLVDPWSLPSGLPHPRHLLPDR